MFTARYKLIDYCSMYHCHNLVVLLLTLVKYIDNVYINQRDAQILVNTLCFFVKWLYMFRTTVSPSSGATFNNLYSAIGTFRYVWLLYTAARRENKDYSQEFVHLVGLYTHCSMMHDTYIKY